MSDRITLSLKTIVLILGFSMIAVPAQATFVGTNVDFSLIEPDPPGPDFLDQKLGVTVSDTGIEVFGGDGSDIGIIMNNGTGPSVPSDGEYIDIGMDFIEFRLFGGGPTASAGGRTTNAPAGTKYQLDFEPGVLALFEAPTLDTKTGTTDEVFGVTFPGELMLTASSLMLFIDEIGIDTTDNFGIVRLDFELKDVIPPNPIPIPAAFPLMLSGLALIGFLARRRKQV